MKLYNKEWKSDNDIDNFTSFVKYVLVAILMWVMTTLTLKIGLMVGINVWIITAFNIGFYGIIKWLLYKYWKVFK